MERGMERRKKDVKEEKRGVGGLPLYVFLYAMNAFAPPYIRSISPFAAGKILLLSPSS
jgi:hypothetical protein